MSKILKTNLIILVVGNALVLLTGDPLTVAFGLMFLIAFQFATNLSLAVYHAFKKNKETAKWYLLASILVLIIGMGTCFGNLFMLEEVFDKKTRL
jgi:O-antigen/teichoic acid export membrane protein